MNKMYREHRNDI